MRIIMITTLYLIGLSLLSPANAAIQMKEDGLSRDFGYVIGDRVTRRIVLEIEHPHKLQQEQIPITGKINRWLELGSSHLEIQRHRRYTRYELTLEYQIFTTEPDKGEILLPGFELTLDIDDRRLPLLFQDLPVKVMRVTPDDPSRSLQFLDLQPPITPQPVSLVSTWLKLAASCLGVMMSLLILAFLYTGFPWTRKLQGPFARALIKLRGLRKSPEHTSRYQSALRYLHEAFNQTHGKVLLHDDLGEFLEQHASFNQIRPELTRLFAKSRAIFFDSADKGDESIAELLAICRQCRDIERGLS